MSHCCFVLQGIRNGKWGYNPRLYKDPTFLLLAACTAPSVPPTVTESILLRSSIFLTRCLQIGAIPFSISYCGDSVRAAAVITITLPTLLITKTTKFYCIQYRVKWSGAYSSEAVTRGHRSNNYHLQRRPPCVKPQNKASQITSSAPWVTAD